MSGLTREAIEKMKGGGKGWCREIEFYELCNMALRSLPPTEQECPYKDTPRKDAYTMGWYAGKKEGYQQGKEDYELPPAEAKDAERSKLFERGMRFWRQLAPHVKEREAGVLIKELLDNFFPPKDPASPTAEQILLELVACKDASDVVFLAGDCEILPPIIDRSNAAWAAARAWLEGKS